MKPIKWAVLLLLPSLLRAQNESFPQFNGFDKAIPAKANKELQFFGYFFNQAVSGNYYPTNDFLKGQIVGRLFGSNTTSTTDTLHSLYFEQRFIPFFVYQPRIFDGKATLRASFEIDWTWGDVAYGVGGNFGSAISADQVNLQTQNLEIEYVPAKHWTINLGLMRLFDTPHDLYRTVFDKMANTGYRLAYWGTDAVGVVVRREKDYSKWKAGFYQLYENNVELDDDVTLTELTCQQAVSPKWNVGASLHYLRDRSGGKGGVSILGQGLNSPLNAYAGTFRFPIGGDPYHADICWLGTYFSRNEEMMLDPWLFSGFLNWNVGRVRQKAAGEASFKKTASISGLGANLRLGYRYGQTTNDAILTDLIFSTGDPNDLNDSHYSGVITGNTWGSPAGIFISHGGYLLFPHGNVVNRFVSAVNDLSNMGLGVSGGTLNFSRDFVPNKLNGKMGLASAVSNVQPPGGGIFMGWEANAKVAYNLGAFMSFELHGAHLWLGDFYDSKIVNGNHEGRPVNPWTVFAVFKWLMF